MIFIFSVKNYPKLMYHTTILWPPNPQPPPPLTPTIPLNPARHARNKSRRIDKHIFIIVWPQRDSAPTWRWDVNTGKQTTRRLKTVTKKIREAFFRRVKLKLLVSSWYHAVNCVIDILSMFDIQATHVIDLISKMTLWNRERVILKEIVVRPPLAIIILRLTFNKLQQYLCLNHDIVKSMMDM